MCVRHDPVARHDGGGSPSTGEGRRLEHLDRFMDQVAGALATDGDLLVIGPGTVSERLVRLISSSDARHHRDRTVTTEAAPRQTEHQLVSRLRRATGAEPRRVFEKPPRADA